MTLRPSLLLFLLLIVATACSSEPTPPPTTRAPVDIPQPSTTPPTTFPPGTQTVTVYLDGWSVALSGATELIADGTKNQTQPLRPLTPGEIESVPDDVLSLIVPRLVAADSGWTCTSGICSSDAGTLITAEQLASPESIPHFGDLYAAHDVHAGVWSATFVKASDTFTHDYRTDTEWSLPRTAYGEPRVEPDATHVTLSAGYGLLFPTDPYFSSPGTAGYYYELLRNEMSAAQAAEADAQLMAALEEGPSSRSAADRLALLSDSELTMMSSPTIGCGSEALCSPAATVENVETLVRESYQVCAEGEPIGAAVLFNQVRELNYLLPTHQYGVWGVPGADSTGFTPPDHPGLIGPTPPLANGPQRVQSWGVHYWSAGLGPDGGARLVTHNVRNSHLLEGEEPANFSPEEILAAVGPDYVETCEYEVSPVDTDSAQRVPTGVTDEMGSDD